MSGTNWPSGAQQVINQSGVQSGGSTGSGFPSGYHRLVVASNSLCLDVYGAGSNQDQQLDQWPTKNAPGTNRDFNPR